MLSAGFRQRGMKTHSATAGGGGQPVAHADSRDASTSAAIQKQTVVLIGDSPPTPISSAHPWAHIRLTMLPMGLPVLRVLCGQGWVTENQQIFRILLLSRLG